MILTFYDFFQSGQWQATHGANLFFQVIKEKGSDLRLTLVNIHISLHHSSENPVG